MNAPVNHLILLIVAAAGMLAYDWRKLRGARTIIAYLTLYISGFTIAFLLVINPNLPGPTQVLRPLFLPLAKLLLKH
ncbi:hypothetical protein [Paenibacillus kobensis]|uniref:hypothetical protein n=1 Tax=Paenibacillus kobensis TaxID=59841 RepID=UPI000FD95BE7|nr:hypothetical protein [Paenibacillus kobensis]